MSLQDILTVEEVYRISYLTMKGWEYQSHSDGWSKEGFSTIRYKRRPCGCCQEEVLDSHLSLEEAYWKQREVES